VDLDRRFYTALANFEARLPARPASLAGAGRPLVSGEVTFRAGAAASGAGEVMT
jgi:hypothetical protein